MGFDLHTVEVPNGSSPLSNPDRIKLAPLMGVATTAAASEGAAVTVAVSGLELPATYGVVATPSQPALVSVGSKTNTGFTVTLTPPSATVTLSAGTVDILVMA
jgi:hypothetical protein